MDYFELKKHPTDQRDTWLLGTALLEAGQAACCRNRSPTASQRNCQRTTRDNLAARRPKDCSSWAYCGWARHLWLLWRRCSRQRPCISGRTRVSSAAWTAAPRRRA